MPNMNEPRSLNIRLNSNQMQLREKILSDLEIESHNLKHKLNYAHIHNIKPRTKRFLMKSGRMAFSLVPTTIIGTGFGFLLSLIHSTPFKLDSYKEYQYYRKTFDSNGNVAYEEKFEPFGEKNSVTYASKWQLTDTSEYVRDIRFYTSSINEEVAWDVMDNVDISYLDNVLGNPSIYTERANKVPEDQLDSEYYIQAVICGKNKDVYNIHEESIEDEVEQDLGFVSLLMSCEFLLELIYIKKDFRFVTGTFSEIENRYPVNDISKQKRRVRCLDDSFNRLGGGNNE